MTAETEVIDLILAHFENGHHEFKYSRKPGEKPTNLHQIAERMATIGCWVQGGDVGQTMLVPAHRILMIEVQVAQDPEV